jgi:hypothetical protein
MHGAINFAALIHFRRFEFEPDELIKTQHVL